MWMPIPPGQNTKLDMARQMVTAHVMPMIRFSAAHFAGQPPGGLDPETNETYEACLGPCFKCAQASIRAQADAGSTDAGQAAFDACYAK